jgi:hypothetical protein
VCRITPAAPIGGCDPLQAVSITAVAQTLSAPRPHLEMSMRLRSLLIPQALRWRQLLSDFGPVFFPNVVID